MYLFRFKSPNGPHLGIDVRGARFDLTAAASEFRDMATWLAQHDAVAAIRSGLEACRRFPIAGDVAMLPPIDGQEVWASGVTYLRSRVARMDESRNSTDIYDQVYCAERPELFFKSAPSRVAGHGMPIRIRRDSKWNVPEPELVLVLSSRGNIVGTTIGNDMSSRSIEGENPLYLPQAKIYDGSYAIGPVIELNEGDVVTITIEGIGTLENTVAYNT